MMKTLTPETSEKIFLEIVEIHKSCVQKTNSKSYPPEIIKEWISNISVGNVKAQIEKSSWVVMEKEAEVLGFAQYSVEEG